MAKIFVMNTQNKAKLHDGNVIEVMDNGTLIIKKFIGQSKTTEGIDRIGCKIVAAYQPEKWISANYKEDPPAEQEKSDD